MISSDDIASYFADPNAIPKSALEDLAALCEKHPYSSSLHILYLKGLSLHQDLEYEEMLKRSAAHAVDREQLYFVISGEEAPEELVPDKEEVKAEEELISEEIEIVEAVEEAVEEMVVAEEELVGETDDEVLDEEEIDEELEAIDVLETDIISEATTTAYELENEKLAAEIEEEVEETEETVEEEVEEEEIEEEEIEEELGEIDYENLSFTQWLKLKQGKPIDEPEDIYFQEVEEEEDEDLVDKFIREEPSLSKPSKQFYDPVQNAKESLVEQSDIVSETLAEVHIQQKNFGKAIETYEQLMLLYPEKKAIFANRIEEINASLR